MARTDIRAVPTTGMVLMSGYLGSIGFALPAAMVVADPLLV